MIWLFAALIGCDPAPHTPGPEPLPRPQTEPAVDAGAIAASLGLPPGWTDQRTAVSGGTTYVWTQWSAQRWPAVQMELGPARDRYAHIARPERPVPETVVMALFPQGHPYGASLNTAGYPLLVRTEWPVRNVEWALVLPDQALLVRVDSAGRD